MSHMHKADMVEDVEPRREVGPEVGPYPAWRRLAREMRGML
jgi:hypothetical protein